MTYVIVGGDLRSIELARLLVLDKNDVSVIGFTEEMLPQGVYMADSNSMDKADVIVMPMVMSYDDININAPYSDVSIKITDILDKIHGQIVILGKISDSIAYSMKERGIHYVDILQREELLVLNAIPTAEGALQVAMDSIPITLHSSNCMILGFGRIGKILCSMLSALGANVYAMARKEKDLACIFARGYNGVHVNELKKTIRHMDVVFNTIPYVILGRDVLGEVKKDSIILDLASKPHGVNSDVAKDMGVTVKYLPGLPGKVAPRTCAVFMRNVIYSIILEGGV